MIITGNGLVCLTVGVDKMGEVIHSISVGGAEYLVHLPENTIIQNTKRAPTVLKRFVEGDTIRFYGAIREDDLSKVDAMVVRNINL